MIQVWVDGDGLGRAVGPRWPLGRVRRVRGRVVATGFGGLATGRGPVVGPPMSAAVTTGAKRRVAVVMPSGSARQRTDRRPRWRSSSSSSLVRVNQAARGSAQASDGGVGGDGEQATSSSAVVVRVREGPQLAVGEVDSGGRVRGRGEVAELVADAHSFAAVPVSMPVTAASEWVAEADRRAVRLVFSKGGEGSRSSSARLSIRRGCDNEVGHEHGSRIVRSRLAAPGASADASGPPAVVRRRLILVRG